MPTGMINLKKNGRASDHVDFVRPQNLTNTFQPNEGKYYVFSLITFLSWQSAILILDFKVRM